MSGQNADSALTSPPKTSGVRTVLRYTGIPVSWLDKRPKLPSRNWLIFLSVTSSVVSYYVYDRQQCKRIRQLYVDRVQSLSEERVDPLDTPRKVMVYASKWPGDEDYEQGLKYFRKYVKPILVAAAVDYDMVAGKRHGDIARCIAEDVRIRRRFDLGLEEDSEVTKALPTYKPPATIRHHELQGGIIIVGRPTFKEFMSGLKQGWTNGPDTVDEEETLARVLEDDHHFDERDDSDPNPKQEPALPQSLVYSSLKSQPLDPSAQHTQYQEVMPTKSSPVDIPPLPPLLLLPFRNRIGFTQIPFMIWDWFNQRYRVESGAELGYQLVMKNTRPIEVPSHDSTALGITSRQIPKQGDLDFDQEAEQLYKKSLAAIPEEIEKSRKEYYEKLPAKLETARALARRLREPTKAEIENPPPTEVELRAERMKKEWRWRNDIEGWNLVKPSSPVIWDERFRNSCRIFVDPPNGSLFTYV